MSLISRLTGTDREAETKLPIHQFCAALQELADGAMTRDQVVAAFSLSDREASELDAMKAEIDKGALTTRKLWERLVLGERKIPPHDSDSGISASINVPE